MTTIHRLRRSGTVLDDPALSEPLTPQEQKAANAASRAAGQKVLRRWLTFAAADQEFATWLCRSVADAFGDDDRLGPLMLKRLQAQRRGKPKRRPRKWTPALYHALLVKYEVLKAIVGRDTALRDCAKSFGLTANKDLTTRKIEERITEARKKVSPKDQREIADEIAIIRQPLA